MTYYIPFFPHREEYFIFFIKWKRQLRTRLLKVNRLIYAIYYRIKVHDLYKSILVRICFVKCSCQRNIEINIYLLSNLSTTQHKLWRGRDSGETKTNGYEFMTFTVIFFSCLIDSCRLNIRCVLNWVYDEFRANRHKIRFLDNLHFKYLTKEGWS